MRDFDVVLLEDETGGYVAIVPALPGCHTQGDTLSEVMENVKEANRSLLGNLISARKERITQRKSRGYTKSESPCLKFRR